MNTVTLKEFKEKFKKLNLPKFDLVVGVATGGIIPTYYISEILATDFAFIWVNFRDSNNKKKFSKPKLLRTINFIFKNKKILIVDDIARTGETLGFVKKQLDGASKIKTFVLSGIADYSIHKDCNCIKVNWKI